MCGADDRGLIIELYDSGGSASVVTFNAGDYPPSMTEFLGSKSTTLTASKSHAFVPERGRHMSNTGKINGVNTGGTIKMLAYWLPLGYG